MSEDIAHPFSGDFTELQRALLSTQTIEQFLQEVALLAARLVPDGMSCGMTMRPDGQPVRWALNSLHRAGLADRVYGPDLTLRVLAGAAAEGLPVYLYGSTDETLDQLVPRLQELFPALLPLIADGKPVGALSLYARDAGAFGAAETRRAEQLAGNASGALSLALRLASYAALTDQLRSSLASRTVIDQAIGVIMAQERCTQAQAFDLLRCASQNRNVKLRDLAAAIVTSVSGEPPQPLVFEDR